MPEQSDLRDLQPKPESKIVLQGEEARRLIILLNIELRRIEPESDFAGRAERALLGKEQAQPLNEVFKQLAGRDHDVYERQFGETMSKGDKPVESNEIYVGEKERSAVSGLLDKQDLRDVVNTPEYTRTINPEYKQTILNLRQKWAVQNK